MKTNLVLFIVLVTGTALAEPPSPEDLAACAKGNGAVCVAVGQRYLNVEKDLPKALTYYLKGCALKVGEGCGFAATMKMHGDGTAKDVARGRTLREQACDLKHSMSCNDLGTGWAEGADGFPSKDFVKARDYYEKACTLGDGLGCFNLGNAYRIGEGAKVDVKRAIALFQKSCDLDSPKGCTELAIIYYEGQAVPKNRDRALELLDKACKLGSEIGCKNGRLVRGG